MTTSRNGAAYLNEQIKALEEKEAVQTLLLKQYARETADSFKPSSMIKSAFGSVASSKHLQQNILDTSLGIGAGLIARKVYERGSKNIFKKLVGFVLQNLTTGFISKKMPGIREKIAAIQTK